MPAVKFFEYISEGLVLAIIEKNGNINKRLICDIDKIPERSDNNNKEIVKIVTLYDQK